ncbi:hypothetical protein [Actinomadura flavalba]|uniref:hypothetical protein n=1 Tax=Actinomadura flavalba TaxID=1120938 RepID=UPI000375CF69|nr:hypothetical protein [Actinomadura flavalba]
MRAVAHLADLDDAIAFPAFYVLVGPALRAAARPALCRARHPVRPCRGPGGGWCDECDATADDLLMKSFSRLRAALAGNPPRTGQGAAVREMAVVCAHLTAPEAADENADAFASVLRTETGEEPAWVRAARFQLVHYPLLHLEERVRRADAVARGAAARPDRDLRTAGWAAPLRTDPVAVDLLVATVFRVRRGAADLDVPDDLRERHGLTRRDAARMQGAALSRLHAVNPGFHAANIGVVPAAPSDPGEWETVSADRDDARATLRRLVVRPAYRAVVAEVCAAGIEGHGDPVAAAVHRLRLGDRAARRFVRRLAGLVAAAGLEWTARLTATSPPPSAVPPPRAARLRRG